MNNRYLWGVLALSLMAAPMSASDKPGKAAKPGIEGLEATLEGDRAVVSFNVAGAISEECEELIQSGIPVVFKHHLDVRAKRNFPLIPMPPRVLARTLVITRVEYDTLTRRYDLLRSIEHRSSKKKLKPPIEEQRLVTESIDEVRAWMTEIDGIEIYDPSRALGGEKLRVRVEVSLGRRYVLLIFPGTLSASAETPLGP